MRAPSFFTRPPSRLNLKTVQPPSPHCLLLVRVPLPPKKLCKNWTPSKKGSAGVMVHYFRSIRITCYIDSRILTHWDSKVIGLNSAVGSGTQPHYEAPGNLHIREVIVACSKLALGHLIQIQVIDSVSDKIWKYIFISNHQVYVIINWLNKNLTL